MFVSKYLRELSCVRVIRHFAEYRKFTEPTSADELLHYIRIDNNLEHIVAYYEGFQFVRLSVLHVLWPPF